MTANNRGAQSQSRWVAKPMDLSTVVVRTKKMSGPKMVLRWNTYVGDCTVLASRLLIALAAELGQGPVKPNHLDAWDLTVEGAAETEELGDVAVLPVQEKSLSTIGVKWDKGSRARVDLGKLFSARRFVVPPLHTANIPVSVEEVPEVGKALVLHFAEAWYAEIDSKGRRKAASEGA